MAMHYPDAVKCSHCGELLPDDADSILTCEVPGCSRRMEEACAEYCETCNVALCGRHAVCSWTPEGDVTFCPTCAGESARRVA